MNVDLRLRDVLACQKQILDESQRWARGSMARTLLGEPVLPLSERAWAWSLTGALAPALLEILGPKASRFDWDRLYGRAVAALWAQLPAAYPRSERKALDLDGFNDYPGTHHEDILEVIERAQAAVGGPMLAA